MKKTYITPSMKMVVIMMRGMIANSGPKVYTTTLAPEAAEGRRLKNSFDDEEDY